MTNNHLLLYRVAELMLQEELQVLPVDLLFDDEQIGDYVKSIQIDSPYQQMLLEGVLTESVRDEKLYVSFTVEGYFHYVIGEVLHRDEKLNEPQLLKSLVESNQLNGLKQGVEQCIILDIKNQNYLRLFELIDLGGVVLECCEFPLAYAFNCQPPNVKDDDAINSFRNQNIEFILSNLMDNATENDLIVLKNCLLKLHNLQSVFVIKSVYRKLFQYLKPIDKLSLGLYVKSIQYLDRSDVGLALNVVDDSLSRFNVIENIEYYINVAFQYNRLGDFNKSQEYLLLCEGVVKGNTTVDDKVISKLFSALATVYFNLEEYQKSLNYWDSSIEILLDNQGKIPQELGSRYNNKATTLMFIRKYEDAKKYFDLAFDIQSKIYGFSHVSITNYYTNIAVLFGKKGDLKTAKSMYEKSIELRIRIYGEMHEKVAVNYNGLGVTYGKLGDMEGAMKYLNIALEIQINIYGKIHPDTALTYKNMGMGYYFNNLNTEAMNYLQVAHGIYSKLYSNEHRAIREIQRTLDNISRN
jgi:tetratricopeptide (TPR) repeat protein